MVDPLDGTVNYANGIPYFCVSMALVDASGPLLGVILDPQRDDLYAPRGGPATLNGEPVHASEKEQLSDYVVSLAVIGRGGLGRERRIARSIRIHRRMGSAALAFAYVANGRFDAFVQNGGLSLWDVAAAGLIAERAGATVSDLHGGPCGIRSGAGRRSASWPRRRRTTPRCSSCWPRWGPGSRSPALSRRSGACRTLANMASVRAVAPQTS